MNDPGQAPAASPAEQQRVLRRPHEGRVIGGDFEFRYVAPLLLIAPGVAVPHGGRSTRR
jgi:hypothetical protein